MTGTQWAVWLTMAGIIAAATVIMSPPKSWGEWLLWGSILVICSFLFFLVLLALTTEGW